MHIGTHFFAGWLVATAPGLSRRERGLITFAGVAPDLDGLGWFVEEATANASHPLPWYSLYHHVLGHNLGLALVVTALAYALARRKAWVAVLAFLSFHLHLLLDLMGSRGSDGYQWPIPYFAPFSQSVQLAWHGQWWVGAWQNTFATFVFVFATVYLAWRLGYSPVGLFNPKADEVFVATLRARFGMPRSVENGPGRARTVEVANG